MERRPVVALASRILPTIWSTAGGQCRSRCVSMREGSGRREGGGGGR